MRDYEETGRSGFHFDPYDIGYVLETFVIPYILDTDTQQYFEQMD